MNRLTLRLQAAALSLGLAACASTPSMKRDEANGPRCEGLARPVASSTRVVSLRVIVGHGGQALQALLTQASGDDLVDNWLLCRHLARNWQVPSDADMARGFIVTAHMVLLTGRPAPEPTCPTDLTCLRRRESRGKAP